MSCIFLRISFLRLSCCLSAVLVLSLLIAPAWGQEAKGKKSASASHGYDYEHPEVQPAAETLDLEMYGRIRSEGLERSRVMDYASALFDGIGPRLTGSPNLTKAYAWTRDEFAAMGCANARLEGWGEFGLGWRQIGTSVDMASPDTAVFIAQATPWSPATRGAVTAGVVAMRWPKDEEALKALKGKFGGKIVLLGAAPEIQPDPKPMLEKYDEKKLGEIAIYPLDGDMSEQHVQHVTPEIMANAFKYINFKEKIAKFLADEGAVAVMVSSYGGDGGIIKDDNNEALGHYVYLPDHKQPIPSAVLSNEGFGRVSRLLEHHVPVTMTVKIDTEFTGEHEPGFDTIAEIPGTDPALKDQVVMLGGHLDSWIAGTGATDDGAGAIIAMEAMRILTALRVKPRRTIRVALWTGEEQGYLGSMGYVKKHFGSVGLSTTPEQAAVPEFLREQVGPLKVESEQAMLSGYFNLDNGGGKLLGIYTEENAAIAPIFAQWMAPLHDLGMTTVSNRYTDGTDHVPFEWVGLPGFQFIQDPRDYETRSVHTNQDTYERLSAVDLKQAAVVEAIFVYNAAMRDQMLPRKPLPWQEGKGGPLKVGMPGEKAP